MYDADNNNSIIEIEVGYEDIFSLDLGWEVSGNAASGIWERGVPIPLNAGAPIELAPPVDAAEDNGNHAFVTGNSSDIFTSLVSGGNTMLTSPVFDATGFSEPFVSFYSWIFDFDINAEEPDGIPMLIHMSNGLETMVIDTLDYEEFAEIFWTFTEYDISSIMTPTDQMTISLEARSSLEFNLVSEAGIDYFQVTDGTAIGISEQTTSGIELNAYPNPSNGQFAVQFDLDRYYPNASIEVYGLMGQLFESKALPTSKGIVYMGDDWSAGIYVLKLRNGNQVHPGIKLVKQ
jgi:hypothetical protein